MIKIYTCVSMHHDWRMVLIAAAVCLLSCATAIVLLDRIRRASGLRRVGWLAVTAIVTGVGIWATHFIAMLGFRPGVASGYDPVGTAGSLLTAIVLFGVAVHVALDGRLRQAPAVGGAVAGLAIGAMHYLGMSAFWVEGHKLFDLGFVAASLALGMVFGALSFRLALGGKGMLRQAGAAILLTAAICGLHFTAMSAVTVVVDPTVAAPRGMVTEAFFGYWVATTALTLLLVCLAALLVSHLQRRSETLRLGELADAAIEGLAICDEGLIVTANAALARMVGLRSEQLTGRPFTDLLADGGLPAGGVLAANVRLDARLQSAAREAIPVELLTHALSSGGRPRLAIAVRDLRDRQEAEAKMRFLAHHDGLTGLPNRLSFEEHLELELQIHRRKHDRFALLYLDLDRFKQVNDLLGHAAGDMLLKSVARRLGAALNEGDFLARLGGDEFAIVRPNIDRLADVARLCERILAAMAPDTAIDDHTASVGASIGVALYPQDGETAALLQRNADVALYQAKSEGKGGYRFFEASLGNRLREREAMEVDLRQALRRGELSLVYQPQVSIRSGEVFGFEALLRWNNPVRGEVPPSVFIPLAEESGLMTPIGDWVLREACAQAARWTRPLQIAVNVSAVQLRSANLPQRIRHILLETGLAPERLEIEVTETALIEDFEQARSILHQLKTQGVKVAMDDFGTGYSSLSNLQAFPFDKIKIDQSFVRNVQDNEHGAAIVRAIVGLCHGLNLSVLAEGVETVEELQFLDKESCLQAQGYLFGRPGQIEHFTGAFEAEILPLSKLRRSV